MFNEPIDYSKINYDKIFINIASYRDPTLVRTIRSALDNAKHPENLVFGICLQYFDYEIPDLSFVPDNQLKIISYHPNERPGVTRVRYEISKLVTDEYWYLMIDSHTNFEKEWDDILIAQMNFFKQPLIDKPVVFSKRCYDPEKNLIDSIKVDLDSPGLNLKFVGVTPESKYSMKYNGIVYDFYETNWAGAFAFFARREWLKDAGHDSITEHFGFEELYMSWRTMMADYKIFSNFFMPLNTDHKEYLQYAWNINEDEFNNNGKKNQDFGELGNSSMRWRRVNPEIDRLDEIAWGLQLLAITYNKGPYRMPRHDIYELLKDKFL